MGQIVVQLGCVLTESRGFHPIAYCSCVITLSTMHGCVRTAFYNLCDQHTGLRSGSPHSDQSSSNAIRIYLAMHYL